jgi:hypothetical protein
MTGLPSVLQPEHRARWGPACGVAFVVLLVAGFLVTSTPNTNKTPAYILAWWNTSSHRNSMKASLILIDTGVLFGVFFFGYLRDRFGRSDVGARLAPIMLAGFSVLAAGGLIFNGATIALLDSPKHLTPDAAQALNFIQSDIGAVAVTIGVSITMLSAGMIILKTRILPVWLAWFSFLLALVGLLGPIGFFAFLAMGIWILIVAVLMWMREEKLPVTGETASGATLSAN